MKFITCLLLLISVFASAQYNDPIEILQASAMPYRTGGSAFGFNNDYYQFLSNGFISDSVYFPTYDFYRFDIGAWSNFSHKQWGNLQIKIDNIAVIDIYINQKTLTFFTGKTYINAGMHKVSIGLTNHTSIANVRLKLGLCYISRAVATGGLILRDGLLLDSFEEDFSSQTPTMSFGGSVSEFRTNLDGDYVITANPNEFSFDSNFLTIDKWSGGHLRGFNEGISGAFHPANENDYKDLAAIGANFVRHHFTIVLNKITDEYQFEQGNFKTFDSILSWAAKYGYYVNIGFDQDPHSNDQLWWGNKRRETSIANLWKQVATRYANNKSVAAFSPLNEPTPSGRVGEYINWTLQIIDSIRTIDTNHCIVFPWAHDFNILDMMLPLPYNNIVYEYHMYDPFEITSQGINGFTQSKAYPSNTYTKADLSLKLDKLRAFEARWNAPIYIGEFGCVRYAPRNVASESSSDRWYLDAVSLFEAEGWPWTAQSWRQSEIWDPEISSWLFYKCSYRYGEPTCNFGMFDAFRTDTTAVMIKFKELFLNNK